MINPDNRIYSLAIKRGNNDYLPLEWNVLSSYNQESLHSLEGIDDFTTKQFRIDLLNDLLDSHLIMDDEKFRDFVIIFMEKGRYREVKEGTIFKEDGADQLDRYVFTQELIDNLDDKDFRNYLLNLNFGNSRSFEMEKFLFIIKNYDSFAARGQTAIKIGLEIVEEIPYNEYRKMAIMVANRLFAVKENKANVLKKTDIA